MQLLRRRLRFTFWLDLKKKDELALAENILDLKEKRLFAKTIRDGIRLILDLRKGRTEVLKELFPWVLEQEKTAPAGHPDSPITAIKAQMDFLTDLLVKQGAVPIEQGEKLYQEQPSSPPLPLIEDSIADKLEVTTAKTVDRWGNFKTLYNMQLSLYGAEPRHWDNLTNDALEYGLETRQFPPSLVKVAEQLLHERRNKQTKPPLPAAPPPPPGNAKKLAGADRELAPPADLDDLDLLLNTS